MFESGNETSFASFAMASYRGPIYCIRWGGNRGRICKEQGELDGEERVKYLKNHNK